MTTEHKGGELAMEAGGHTGQSRNGDDNSGTVARHHYSSNVLCRTTYEYITCCYYFAGKLEKGQSFSRCQESIGSCWEVKSEGPEKRKGRKPEGEGLVILLMDQLSNDYVLRRVKVCGHPCPGN